MFFFVMFFVASYFTISRHNAHRYFSGGTSGNNNKRGSRAAPPLMSDPSPPVAGPAPYPITPGGDTAQSAWLSCAAREDRRIRPEAAGVSARDLRVDISFAPRPRR